MNKLIIRGAVLAACVAGPASAADLPISPEYAERPPIVGLLNWAGFYLGANLGYARSPGSADVTACVVTVAACVANGVPIVAGVPLFSLSETMSGVIGGVQAGANWHRGRFSGDQSIKFELQRGRRREWARRPKWGRHQGCQQ